MLFPLAIWVVIWAPQYIGKNPKSFTLADEMAQAHSRFSDQSVGDITKKY
jgi:ribosomal protein S3AE